MRPPRQLLAKLVLLRARNALEYSACGPVMSLAFLTILGCLHLREPSTGDSVHILCRTKCPIFPRNGIKDEALLHL